MKDINHIIVSKDTEKSFDEIQYSFNKPLNKLGTEVMYLNIIKAIYNKPTASIPNGERLKTFLLRSGTRLECPLLPLLLSIVLKALAKAIRQVKGRRQERSK